MRKQFGENYVAILTIKILMRENFEKTGRPKLTPVELQDLDIWLSALLNSLLEDQRKSATKAIYCIPGE